MYMVLCRIDPTIVKPVLFDAFQCDNLHVLLGQTQVAAITIWNNCSQPCTRASPDSSCIAPNSEKGEKDIDIIKRTPHAMAPGLMILKFANGPILDEDPLQLCIVATGNLSSKSTGT